jgi:SAM-dependent methyltransferase
MTKQRSQKQKIVDFISFPLRALVLFHEDRWGLSSLASERFDYVAREVSGGCLDVGCGRHNRFIKEYLGGNGKGIDVFPYEGLDRENVVEDLTHFPVENDSFETVTFIANINHIPRRDRDAELAEAYRILRPNGKIIVTMGNPLSETIVHKLVWLYDRLLKTNLDMDSERGMDEEEEYYLKDKEIIERLQRAGFGGVIKKYFVTQWGFNHLFVGQKS